MGNDCWYYRAQYAGMTKVCMRQSIVECGRIVRFGLCPIPPDCGYDDVEVGGIERGGKTHLLLIGLDGDARFGDQQLGCIAVAPVEVE